MSHAPLHLYLRNAEYERTSELDLYESLRFVRRFNDVGAWELAFPATTRQAVRSTIADYEATVLGLSPLAYWRMDPGAGVVAPGPLDITGASGSRAEITDANLLDSDSAHLVQGTGAHWQAAGGMNAGTFAHTPDADFFGTGGGSCDTNGASAHGYIETTGAAYATRPPVTAGTTYSATVRVKTDTAGRRAGLFIRYYDSGGVQTGQARGPQVNLTANVAAAITQTYTAPAGSAYVAIIIDYEIDGTTTIPAGETVSWGSAAIRSGSTALFIPSINIVGDIDVRARFAFDSFPFTADFAAIAGKELYPSDISWWLRGRSDSGTGARRIDWTLSADGTAHTALVTDAGDLDAFGDGDYLWVQGTRVRSSGATEILVSGDDTDWDEVVTFSSIKTGTAYAGSDLHQSVEDLRLGGLHGGNSHRMDGKFRVFVLRDGIDGPVVARVRFADYAGQEWEAGDTGTTTRTDEAGQSVSILGNATILDGQTLADGTAQILDLSGNGYHLDPSITADYRTALVSGAIADDTNRAMQSPEAYGGNPGPVATRVEPSSIPNPNDTMTVAFWLRQEFTSTTQFYGYVSSINFGTTQGWHIDRRNHNAEQTLGVRIDTSAGANQVKFLPDTVVAAGQDPFDGDWHLLVLTLADGDLEWWFDGELVSSQTYNHGDGFANELNGSERIEVGSTRADGTIVGMDEVALWDRALTASEIVTLYEVGVRDPKTVMTSVSVPTVVEGDGIEVIRPDTGAVVFSGPLTEIRREIEGGSDVLVLSGLSDDHVLADRVAHPQPGSTAPPYSTSAYDVRTDLASTLLYEYVDVNVGPSAIGSRINPYLTLAADPLLGSSFTARARYHNLLEFLRSIATRDGTLRFSVLADTAAAGVEFAIEAVTDLTGTAQFSVPLGNVARIELLRAAPSVTYAYVGGGGVGTARTIRERSSSLQEAAWSRRVEQFVDRRDTTNSGELDDAGDEVLSEGSDRFIVSTVPIDTEQLTFGDDYDLGDKVTLVVGGVVFEEVIREAEFVVQNGHVTVEPRVGTPQMTTKQGASRTLRQIASRLSNLERE